MQYNQQAPPPQQMMAVPVQNVVVMHTPIFGPDPVSQKNTYVHQPLSFNATFGPGKKLCQRNLVLTRHHIFTFT